jgi:hypothetical protein
VISLSVEFLVRVFELMHSDPEHLPQSARTARSPEWRAPVGI